MKKTIYLFLTLALSLSSCGKEAKAEKSNEYTIPSEVKLTHRILNGCLKDSCYFDVFNMKQEYGRGLSLSFGNDHGENLFRTNHAGGQISSIIDLGQTSCQDIQANSENSINRQTEAYYWFQTGRFWSQLRKGDEKISAKEGHCYLMFKSNFSHEIILMFNVKELQKDDFVIINELEVFKRVDLTPTN